MPSKNNENFLTSRKMRVNTLNKNKEKTIIITSKIRLRKINKNKKRTFGQRLLVWN